MILRSPTEHDNGGFPFVARMEQSVIRVSSFTHTVASATPHATVLDSASLHPGYNSKPIPTPRIFKGGTKFKSMNIRARSFVVRQFWLTPRTLSIPKHFTIT